MDTSLMREDTTNDTYSPPSEVNVKNVHVQEVEEWRARWVKETVLDFIKSDALDKEAKMNMSVMVCSAMMEEVGGTYCECT
jgi:flagellar motor switch protein FliM